MHPLILPPVMYHIFLHYLIKDTTFVRTLLFDGSHPDVSRNYQNSIVSVKHNLIFPLITIRLATCFDPTGSLSGLLYEPINVRSFLTLIGS